MLIGLTGKAGSGKDTAALHLALAHEYARLAFADPLREMLKAGLGLGDEAFTPAQKNIEIPAIGKSPRQLMQTLGTDWGRNLVAHDIWLRAAAQRISRAESLGFATVITDVRFENEAEFVRSRGGIIIKLERQSAEPVAEHISEAGIALTENDFIIRNEFTLADLHEALDIVIDAARSRKQ